MNTIFVNNISLAYERLGKGVPLLLVHGFPLDHTIWTETAALLADKFDLILPDLRGFGRSTTVDAAYTMFDMADDLAALLDHLGLEKAALAGHSMGGYVALAFAKKYPQRVSGLALVASQAAADTPERKANRYSDAGAVAQKGVGLIAEGMTPRLSADLKTQEFVRPLMERQTPAAVIGALKAMAEREDTLAALLAAPFPLVLIHGDMDVLIPIERAREIKAALPFARLVELQGIGHMPMMESPARTADALALLIE
ncbi:MAG: alpha/beta hydrolase [Chloroflexi bacterium]|nr:alpha/beta hydrolase [Chloroflexota bacterium]